MLVPACTSEYPVKVPEFVVIELRWEEAPAEIAVTVIIFPFEEASHSSTSVEIALAKLAAILLTESPPDMDIGVFILFKVLL